LLELLRLAEQPMQNDQEWAEAERQRSPRARRAFTALLVLLAAMFLALGTWQVQRLFWKLDLIARVDARVHAEPVAAPTGAIDPAEDDYRHVTATGLFDHDKTVLVQAVTERGSGFWVVTPLRADDAPTILVNRGFVPADRSARGFLRANDPAGVRWYSRDVAAIAAAKGVANVAPYFIDADATKNPGGLPIGGLTVVAFRNSHLVYALTWYAMAAGLAGALIYVRRRAP